MRHFLIYFLLLLFMTTCKKPYKNSENECKTTYFGYSVPTDTTFLLIPKCTFGTINSEAGSLTAIATLRNTLSNSQGTFNTHDYCYYTLQVVNDTDQPLLYRISLDGRVTEFEGPGDNKKYEGLLFRPLSGKLCAFERNLGTGDISFCELSLIGSSFKAKAIVKAIPYASPQSYIWNCVNKETDEVFFTLTSGHSSRVYLLDTGKRPTLYYDSPAATLWGVCLNAEDGMLYCVEKESTTCRLVKIAPNGGGKIVTALPDSINESCISTCLGRCHNEFVISGKAHSSYGYFLTVNLVSGATRKLSTPYVLMSMAAAD